MRFFEKFRRKSRHIDRLIGYRCRIVFDLPINEWPISGYPAWAVVQAVEMPLILVRAYGGGMWINAANIKTIEPMGHAKD